MNKPTYAVCVVETVMDCDNAAHTRRLVTTLTHDGRLVTGRLTRDLSAADLVLIPLSRAHERAVEAAIAAHAKVTAANPRAECAFIHAGEEGWERLTQYAETIQAHTDPWLVMRVRDQLARIRDRGLPALLKALKARDRDALKAMGVTVNHDGEPDLTSLPTYGGEAPADTTGVWSWDYVSVMAGDDLDDLRIFSRDCWDHEER